MIHQLTKDECVFHLPWNHLRPDTLCLRTTHPKQWHQSLSRIRWRASCPPSTPSTLLGSSCPLLPPSHLPPLAPTGLLTHLTHGSRGSQVHRPAVYLGTEQVSWNWYSPYGHRSSTASTHLFAVGLYECGNSGRLAKCGNDSPTPPVTSALGRGGPTLYRR